MSEPPATSSPAAEPLLRLRRIEKSFGPVRVLCGVDFDVRRGEVHVLAGENGAGKSTLIKILGGVYSDYGGTIELRGSPVRFRSPLHANGLGIGVIFQELSLVPAMSVTDNIFLGREQSGGGGFVRAAEQRRLARATLGKLGLGSIDVDRPVEQLPIGMRQMVEIAKAVSRDVQVLVMDEPTSALSRPDVAKLFALVARLKAQGCGIVYITHKMAEIEQIADRITVLRDGRWVGTAPAKELPEPKLVQWMIGREVGEAFPRHAGPRDAEVRLRVEGLSVHDTAGGVASVSDVSFTARRGEIVGIGGLQGSGASQLLLGLFGAYGRRATRGRVSIDGQPLPLGSVRKAIGSGLAMVTNDRKANGLILQMPITANATLTILDRLAAGGWRRPDRERETAERWAKALRLRAASLQMEVGALSGGNQQKVVLAKWLATEPKVLLLDEPTRGIDIGAKHDIYRLMNEWTAQGITVLLITSELPELLAMSDRILVMHRGRITAELEGSQMTADAVLRAAMGATTTTTTTTASAGEVAA